MGVAGDNVLHRHWAHQVTIALGGYIEVKTHTKTIQTHGVFIPANCVHQLTSGQILSLYIDPADALAACFSTTTALHSEVMPLPVEVMRTIREVFSTSCSLNQQLVVFRELFLGNANLEFDARFIKVLAYLQLNLLEPDLVSRTRLAKLIGMSDSRFSHWFKQRAAIPLRSYQKWLRLITGVQNVLLGASYTNAAHAAGFSDQAHFTRTFVDAFGINPSVALNQIKSGVSRRHR